MVDIKAENPIYFVSGMPIKIRSEENVFLNQVFAEHDVGDLTHNGKSYILTTCPSWVKFFLKK